MIHHLMSALDSEPAIWQVVDSVQKCHGCQQYLQEPQPPPNLLAYVSVLAQQKLLAHGRKPRGRNCRGCGHVFCFKCSEQCIELPKVGYTYNVAVCSACEKIEKDRRSFLKHDLSLVIKGQAMVKLSKTIGTRSRERLLVLSYDGPNSVLECIDPTHSDGEKSKKEGKAKKVIGLQEITAVKTVAGVKVAQGTLFLDPPGSRGLLFAQEESEEFEMHHEYFGKKHQEFQGVRVALRVPR